jgi:hypothetical protein
MTVETNIDEAADEVELRELWSIATMIRRRQDEEAQGPEPKTYLGLALSAPEVGGRFGVKPMVVGSGPFPAAPAGSAWSTEVVGNEEPLNYAVDEVGAALGGAGGSHESMSGRVEIAAPAQVGGADSGKR